MADPAILAEHPRAFGYVAAAWLAHPADCTSLQEFWFGRHGGVTCPADISDCDGCGVTFFVEGLTMVVDEALCGCCARTRQPT